MHLQIIRTHCDFFYRCLLLQSVLTSPWYFKPKVGTYGSRRLGLSVQNAAGLFSPGHPICLHRYRP